MPTGQVQAEPLATPAPGGGRSSRRRSRRWYRRPLLVVPLVLLLLLSAGGATAFLYVNRSLDRVQSVSDIPPVVTSTDEELGDTEVAIDTGPAVAALSDLGLAPDDGGLLGAFQDGAGNATDLTGGALAAAGLASTEAGPMTVMILGVDARPGAPIDVGVRADTIMVARIDPTAGTCRMLSVPRDTRVVLPGYGESKVNHALLVGGVRYQQLVLEQTLGLTIDHYGLLDFSSFAELVDYFGPITIDVAEPLVDSAGVEQFAAGPQEMDGETALRYARFRSPTDGGDAARVERQWDVLRAIGSRAESGDVARQATDLLPLLSDHMRTDLDVSTMVALGEALQGRCTSETIDIEQLSGTRVRLNDAILQQSVYFNEVSASAIRERVAWLLGQ